MLQGVRGLVPARLVPGLVRRRVRGVWADPLYRARHEAEMEFLLGCSERAGEVPELARAYTEQGMLRTWMRWQPRAITRQEVRGAEWLTSRRDLSRPLVLSFMHHARYDGMFASLARHGADLRILTLADALEADAPTQIRQHVRVVRRGGTMLPTTGGTGAVLAALQPGVTLAIASDVAGQTPVEFLGRRVLGSSGAARIAVATDSPVVLVTSHREGEGHYLQVHPPLEPSAFGGWEELLAEILSRHGEAVLAWPEALDNPLHRWGALEAETVTYA
jgi:lauroyl/myristoyl acyltransferase